MLAERPALRTKLVEVRRSYTQVLDETSKDEVIDAGFSRDATDRARTTIESWQAFVDEHRDDIDALQILYSRPYGKRLTLKAIKELAARHRAAAVQLDTRAALGRLRGARSLTGAGLGGHAVHQPHLASSARPSNPTRDLVAYPLTVDERFQNWLAQQAQAGTTFTDEQLAWLTRIKDHLATSLTIAPDDFELEPFVGHGGYGRANTTFAGRLAPLLDELTQELVA